MLRIDQFAYANRLRTVHPAEKLSFAVLTLVICLAVSRPLISMVVILIMGVGIVLRAGIPLRFYLKLMLVPLVFLLIGVFTVAFQISRYSLPLEWGFTAWDVNVGVTAASLGLAGNLFLKSLGTVSCLYFLALTTPVLEIMWIMKKAKVPALFLELMLIVYRFIFVLMETASGIYISQASRWGYASLKTSYYSLAWLAANLFVKSYHHARQLFAALLARCYQEELKVLEMPYSISGKNIALVALFELALLVLVWRTGVGVAA
ncbi:cobalt ECF transporter T component CbiQ [Pelotomaculum isophthalicicum JI]|uniref:Cobalt ECF transporter T component CbiQ n=1 Tax=Pelotomaculum isophthalicicum JI TaxID=947010 RepID=A0A9X4GZI6_9FIRM|nr:cobalt ECF transporter T component CbiQ [Pelotomaculum isophthalicicum]MDF9408840.1 cobalt ECF transporter T component CbiQ [Pelotomaculum isophthalicicum JI]